MWNLVLYLKRKYYICQESNIDAIGAPYSLLILRVFSFTFSEFQHYLLPITLYSRAERVFFYHFAIFNAITHGITFTFCRGNATGTACTAGTATAVPNISQISSGQERFFYFIGQSKNLVWFQSYILCSNSSSDTEYSLETPRDYLCDQQPRFCYQGLL